MNPAQPSDDLGASITGLDGPLFDPESQPETGVSTGGGAPSGVLGRVYAGLVHPWLPLTAAWVLLLALSARIDPFILPLVALAFAGAFLSGLVGVGGAIVMIPLLLYVPPLLGFTPLDIHTVAGITIVQVTAAALAGMAGHREGVDRGLFIAIGPAMVLASFVGALGSALLSPVVLEAVFAAMATVAAALMLGLGSRSVLDVDGPVRVNRPAAVVAGLVVGLGAGLVGAGGAFFLIPVMLLWLRIPVRVTVGTSLAVVLASAVAGLAGKALTGQIEWIYGLTLIVGALPGARLGSYLSRRTRTDRLVLVLGVLIAVVAVRMWIDVLT